jgi:hypothetical protein
MKKLLFIFIFVFFIKNCIFCAYQFVPHQLIIQESLDFFPTNPRHVSSTKDVLSMFDATIEHISLIPSTHPATSKKALQTLTTYKATFPENTNLDEVIDILRTFQTIHLIQKNQTFTLFESPDDPLNFEQYYLQSIDASLAWDITQGDSQIIVAVLDSGIMLDHPDLIGSIHPDGKDTGSNDDDPSDESGNSHGTHVAGIIAAQTNNRLGISGVAFRATILPIKVVDDLGTIDTISVINGIQHAINNDADIIHMSFGGESSNLDQNPLFFDKVQEAVSHEIVMVASAGNIGISNESNIDVAGIVPATYPNVIAVSATNKDHTFANGLSMHGDSVDFSAPGKLIFSTSSTPPFYSALSGTSFSAPIVSGTAALILSVYPESTPSEVFSLLKEGAVDLGEKGKDPFFGHGMVNAYQSLLKSPSSIQFDVGLSRFFSIDTPLYVFFDSIENPVYSSFELRIRFLSEEYSYTKDSEGISLTDSVLSISPLILAELPTDIPIEFLVTINDASSNKYTKSLILEHSGSFDIFGAGGKGTSVFNAPNPFNPNLEKTSIVFEITTPASITIDIYSLELKLIKRLFSGFLSAGYYDSFFWDGKDDNGNIMPNGVYVFVLTGESDGKKLIRRNKIVSLKN